MSAYYNEFDPGAAAWLRELIKLGLIADGEVDERSILDVQPVDLAGFTQCHFFAGIGGWSYALRLAGWPDDQPVWTGSCPCQPFSVAGSGRAFDDERHLWPDWFRLIRECKPSVVFGEQVASKHGIAWLDLVSSNMEEEGYAFGAAVLPACSVGAPHIRQRQWWGANSIWNEQSRKESRCGPIGRMGRIKQPVSWNEPWQSALSRLRTLGDGIPRRVDWTDGARNAIVPQVAAIFIKSFVEATECINGNK